MPSCHKCKRSLIVFVFLFIDTFFRQFWYISISYYVYFDNLSFSNMYFSFFRFIYLFERKIKHGKYKLVQNMYHLYRNIQIIWIWPILQKALIDRYAVYQTRVRAGTFHFLFCFFWQKNNVHVLLNVTIRFITKKVNVPARSLVW